MPVHDFWLVPENKGDYSPSTYGNYDQLKKKSGKVTLHDDFVLYMMDFLKWIPTLNPSSPPKKRDGYGLNYYGSTVINKKGAAKFARIFRLWGKLLRESPPKLKLTGPYLWHIIDFDSDGHEILDKSKSGYHIIKAERKAVVKKFHTLADYADQAATGKFFILHHGI